MTRCKMMKGKIPPENSYSVRLCRIQSFLHEGLIGCTRHTRLLFGLTYIRHVFTDQFQLQVVFTSWVGEGTVQKSKGKKVSEALLAASDKFMWTNFLRQLSSSQVLHWAFLQNNKKVVPKETFILVCQEIDCSGGGASGCALSSLCHPNPCIHGSCSQDRFKQPTEFPLVADDTSRNLPQFLLLSSSINCRSAIFFICFLLSLQLLQDGGVQAFLFPYLVVGQSKHQLSSSLQCNHHRYCACLCLCPCICVSV